ncbi:ComEA family DNA-binding protein [Methylobacterium nonmethylotrophicum]|uniref:Helix-hairpin-helix domain-containing protein n=1 Tax=Methylobacterium nonmethylotrophicum TaxID=1141884 RepID=A0A4Z0NLN8_9HYPH|nr:helix-hairpin-helix domain-containing protein [Methylobacterium nonmethylotrophicum]TGD97172.1 helix-hairpin-helix domain-containing protein [Methylobacterium nonmethylotrophicum]
MLTGSAITRALVIVVLAAGLAGLWQLLMPRATGPNLSEPPKVSGAGRTGQPPAAPAGEDPVRSVYPGPRPAESAPPRQPPAAETARAPNPAPAPSYAPPPSPAPPSSPAPAQTAAALPVPPPVFAPPAPADLPPAERTAAEAPAAGTIDLNTASLAELNGLRGGGMIGKAIIARRPYASPSELLSKRVLSRATYDRIKDQVTVR